MPFWGRTDEPERVTLGASHGIIGPMGAKQGGSVFLISWFLVGLVSLWERYARIPVVVGNGMEGTWVPLEGFGRFVAVLPAIQISPPCGLLSQPFDDTDLGLDLYRHKGHAGLGRGDFPKACSGLLCRTTEGASPRLPYRH